MIYGPYMAKVVDIHDGDTVGLDIDLGFGITMTTRNIRGTRNLTCRIFGINAPELVDKVTGQPNKAGLDSRAFLARLMPVGSFVSVSSHGWDREGGRFDGDIMLPGGTFIAAAMIAAGQAVAKDYT